MTYIQRGEGEVDEMDEVLQIRLGKTIISTPYYYTDRLWSSLHHESATDMVHVSRDLLSN